MEEDRKVTIEDVLKMSLDTLNGMQIRMDEYDRIGGPVSKVMHNLGECISAIERWNAAEAATQQPVGTPSQANVPEAEVTEIGPEEPEGTEA